MNVALIPARGGSQRLPRKNVKVLGDMPLIAWTIRAAIESECYHLVVVCTDDDEIASIARPYNPDYILMREPSSDVEADLEWVVPMVERIEEKIAVTWPIDAFSILRPTSPFRSADTIRRAWEAWGSWASDFDSMRAVRGVREHPYKMWRASHGQMRSFTDAWESLFRSQPWNKPVQMLGQIWVQTAGLEIAHRRVLPDSISGMQIAAFELSGPEALDINDQEDWWVAEAYVRKGLV